MFFPETKPSPSRTRTWSCEPRSVPSRSSASSSSRSSMTSWSFESRPIRQRFGLSKVSLMKKSILPALLLFLGSTGIQAADFWKEKEYKQWKTKEVHRMLTKSPWAQTRGGRVEAIAGNPNGSPQRGIPVGLGGADGGDGGGPGFFGGGQAGHPGAGSLAASLQRDRPLGQRPAGEAGHHSVPLPAVTSRNRKRTSSFST